MKKLRIGYFADGPWSHRAFEKIIAKEHVEIAFIVPRTDTADATLQGYCEKYNIPYLAGCKINSEAFFDIASSYACDLFVSMSFNQIFKERIINLPPLKTINCHAGKLPFYRGRNILNWALINDEKEFGITVHYIDETIDTGDIILQECYPITDSSNYETLLLTAYDGCADVLSRAIDLIAKDEVRPIQQNTIHSVGMYCGARRQGDEILHWNKPSRIVFNFIRSICTPGPMAHTKCNGHIVKINRCNEIPNAVNYIGVPGQIIGKTERGWVVKTEDSSVEVFDIDTEVKLKIGDRFEWQ